MRFKNVAVKLAMNLGMNLIRQLRFYKNYIVFFMYFYDFARHKIHFRCVATLTY